MVRKMRKRITYGNVILTIMLVFVMSGGAYAASKYLITSTKQISPKVLKALASKKGPAGPAGAAGSVGPVGPAGAPGAKGDTGAPGATGSPGTSGTKGDTGAQGPSGAKGTSGAAGPAGPTGPQGPLQPGKVEGGQWSVKQFMSGETFESVSISLSFPVPLASALDAQHVHYIGVNEGAGESKENLPTGCHGNYKEPVADSGYLCVFTKYTQDFSKLPPENGIEIPFTIYDASEGEPGEGGEVGASTFGAFMSTELNFKPVKGLVNASGDWVVTG